MLEHCERQESHPVAQNSLHLIENMSNKHKVGQEVSHSWKNKVGGGPNNPTTSKDGRLMPGTRARLRGVGEIAQEFSELDIPTLQGFGDREKFSGEDDNAWKLVWKLCALLPDRFPDESIYPGWGFLLIQQCKDWPEIDDIAYDHPFQFGIGAATVIYGGLHTVAWFAHFNTLAEQTLWRVCSCLVIGGFPTLCLLFKRHYWYFQNKFLRHKFWGLLAVLQIATIFVYMVARAYLLVECFINLAHLPADVYNVPSWSSYFPHIS